MGLKPTAQSNTQQPGNRELFAAAATSSVQSAQTSVQDEIYSKAQSELNAVDSPDKRQPYPVVRKITELLQRGEISNENKLKLAEHAFGLIHKQRGGGYHLNTLLQLLKQSDPIIVGSGELIERLVTTFWDRIIQTADMDQAHEKILKFVTIEVATPLAIRCIVACHREFTSLQCSSESGGSRRDRTGTVKGAMYDMFTFVPDALKSDESAMQILQPAANNLIRSRIEYALTMYPETRAMLARDHGIHTAIGVSMSSKSAQSYLNLLRFASDDVKEYFVNTNKLKNGSMYGSEVDLSTMTNNDDVIALLKTAVLAADSAPAAVGKNEVVVWVLNKQTTPFL